MSTESSSEGHSLVPDPPVTGSTSHDTLPVAPGGTVLVGVDDSPESEAAVRWALRYAAATKANIAVVHAWHLTYEYAWISNEPSPDDPVVVARQEVAAMVANARSDTGIDADAVATTITIPAGRPVPTLLDAAKEADLVVLGRRGRGGFTGLLLGSVSAQVVAHAPCTVVVVRPEAAR